MDGGRRRRGGGLGIEQIPVAETREYVERVPDAPRDYREKYSREFGL